MMLVGDMFCPCRMVLDVSDLQLMRLGKCSKWRFCNVFNFVMWIDILDVLENLPFHHSLEIHQRYRTLEVA